ncbi:MAG: hypothetical protein WAM85_11465 [Terracidiphilus sp.]
MEADWEVEVGGESPVIEAQWPGFVDIEHTPQSAWLLPEAAKLPALAGTLAKLNAAVSPVWTSKSDVWPVTEFDPDELDAPADAARCATACYIDILPRSDQMWPTLALTAQWCKSICTCIRPVPLRCCRADFVVRQAVLVPERTDLGITAYLTACGQTPANAAEVLTAALAVLSDSILLRSPAESAASKLQ